MLKLITFSIFFSAICWILVFTGNPYRFCKDHPDPDLKDHYYLCEPFGFDFPKGKLEATDTDRLPIWSNGRYIGPTKNDKDFYKMKKDRLCSDPAFVKSEHGKEVCGSNE